MARTTGTPVPSGPRRTVRSVVAHVRDSPHRTLAAVLALLAGAVVLFLAHDLFPYHSANHDEGVYLQQAAMLLDGRLAIHPPVPEAMRPWFFVADGGRLYPKYAPVPAAVFAIGEALAGSYRLSLAAVAAANVACCYAVAAEAFDRRTGVLAAAFLLASPLFLIDSSVFLPYAPTTMLNLVFAFAYLRAAGSDSLDGRSLGYAALAGLAVGLAFFARPFTAVLFAAPFLVHAGWQIWTSRFARPVLARQGVTAALGLLGVAVALGYNAVVTGSAFVFPYEAFAPQDGIGFGHREILGYEREYTPLLALRANAEALRLFFTRWVAAGPLGSALALVGLAVALRGIRRSEGVRGGPADTLDERSPAGLRDRQVRLLLAGVVLSVVVGNLAFWGNLNVLGDLGTDGDGLVALLGPYYHFDLLVPTAAFAAHGSVVLAGRFRAGCRAASRERARELFVVGLLATGLVVAGVAAGVAADPVRENAEVTDRYEQAYAPFENESLDGSVVLLPTPYGDWLAHPFQALRNDPGFDGSTVYALDRDGDNFAVVDAYPDRARYRYVYRGAWAPTAGASVDARLQPVRVVEGDRVELRADLGVPSTVEEVTVRLDAGDDQSYYVLDGTPANASLRLSLADGRVRLSGPAVESVGDSDGGVRLGSTDELTVEAFLDAGPGRGFSYRLAVPVEADDGAVRAMTPAVEVCRVPSRCGGEAAYLPRLAGDGVFVDVRLETGE